MRSAARSLPPPPTGKVAQRFAALIDALAKRQAESPWLLIFLVALLSGLGLYFTTRLELRTRYDQLLPDSQPSVIELRRVTENTNTSQSIVVMLEGNDTALLRKFGDALVPEVKALGPSVVSHAEDGIHEARNYLQPRSGLFAKRADLEKFHDDLEARWDWEVGKAQDTNLDDDAAEPPKIDAEMARKRFGLGDKDKKERFPDGYYQTPEGNALVVMIGTPIQAGDLAGSEVVRDKVEAVVSKVHARPEFASVKVGYAGDLITSLAEYGTIKRDLFEVGLTGIAMVLCVVLLYFMRARALVVMAITILCGLCWTFGLTQVAIGHVNVATGFLFSIVAGNGINVGVLYLARYYEERRAGANAAEAILTTHRATWQSTLVAAVVAAAAYMSLSVTDFRAFKHFAFIGASGMICCWLVTLLLLPALLVVFDAKTVHVAANENMGLFARLRRSGISYGRAFSYLVPKAPRLILGLGVLIAIAGAALSVRYAKSDPMEYDLRKVQNARSETGDMYRISDLSVKILGEYKSAMVVLCKTPEQAQMLEESLQVRWNAAPEGQKPFEGVHALMDFVPKEQAEKLPTLVAIRDRLIRAHEKNMISEKDWKELEPILPTDKVVPFTAKDLPEDLARSFTDKSGTRGTLVLIQPTVGQDDEDLRYLIRYADSFRETILPNGDLVRGSGRAVVFADILKAVTSDIPKAVSLSLVMTFLTVFLAFRRGPQSLSVLAALFVGLAGVAIYMQVTHIKINFLNFAALPITFAIGVDYAVNLMQRYHADGGSRRILSALETTGGAVVLCSLTTILGYLALVRSHNQAIGSLGRLAVMGEISCLLAAVLVLPAGWYLLEQRADRNRKDKAPEETPAAEKG
ncbi:MAG: MMPL family transporter [Polyangiaceae bacterium]